MRLLNAHTLRLEDFWDERSAPSYAVLSHTWGDREVHLGDLSRENSKKTCDWTKVSFAATQATQDDIDYLWVDTCCIDKSSSAELSEAINSMFRWYQKATICYAYLTDVVADEGVEKSAFACSRWFTRGWTLQELLVPPQLRFYEKMWTCLGTRQALSEPVSKITGIPKAVLEGQISLEEVDIATKMSWACGRQTARIEDEAYALMGLFGIHMSILYGEGCHAHTRLCKEIARSHHAEPALLDYISHCLAGDTTKLPPSVDLSRPTDQFSSDGQDTHSTASSRPGDTARICAQCQRMFYTLKDLEAHARTTACLAFKCTQLGCDTAFTARTALVRHVNTLHSKGSRGHGCPLCGKVFGRKDNLLRHSASAMCARRALMVLPPDRDLDRVTEPLVLSDSTRELSDLSQFSADVDNAMAVENDLLFTYSTARYNELIAANDTVMAHFGHPVEADQSIPEDLGDTREEMDSAKPGNIENGGANNGEISSERASMLQNFVAGRHTDGDQEGNPVIRPEVILDDAHFEPVFLSDDVLHSAGIVSAPPPPGVIHKKTPSAEIARTSRVFLLDHSEELRSRAGSPVPYTSSDHTSASNGTWIAVNHPDLRNEHSTTGPKVRVARSASARSQKSERQRIACPVCNRDFSRQGDYIRHADSYHSDSARFKCIECSQTTKRKDKMKLHCRRRHGHTIGHETFLDTSEYVDVANAL